VFAGVLASSELGAQFVAALLNGRGLMPERVRVDFKRLGQIAESQGSACA
jgi:hypothetical protein